MSFMPKYPEQLAGLAYMYDAMNFYIIGKTVTDEGKPILAMIKSDTGVITDEMEPVFVPQEASVRFRVEVSEDGTKAAFYYSLDETDWQQAGEEQTTQILTDEHCRGFTGAYFGLYCHDMTGMSRTADFDYFCLKSEK